MAALVSGLRDDARLREKYESRLAGKTDILLAVIADRIDEVLTVLTGSDRRDSIAGMLMNQTPPEEAKPVMAFDTVEEFMEYRYGEKTWQRL